MGRAGRRITGNQIWPSWHPKARQTLPDFRSSVTLPVLPSQDLRTEKPVPRQNPPKSKRLSFSLLLLVGFLLFSASTASAWERDWQPERTWVFIVGTLKWQHSEMFESFPQQNRRDAQLAEFFRRQGVPPEQMVYLQDEQATTRRVRNEFSEILARTKEGDLLFVYFTGHGYQSDDERQTFFATYNASESVPGWSTESIISDINQSFRGSRVLLTADCCYSGSLAKEARR